MSSTEESQSWAIGELLANAAAGDSQTANYNDIKSLASDFVLDFTSADALFLVAGAGAEAAILALEPERSILWHISAIGDSVQASRLPLADDWGVIVSQSYEGSTLIRVTAFEHLSSATKFAIETRFVMRSTGKALQNEGNESNEFVKLLVAQIDQ